MRSTRRAGLLPLIMLTLQPSAAWAQSPMWIPHGPPFRANTYTTGAQSLPSVAFDFMGKYVVVWASDGQDGSDQGIFGQRYAWDWGGLPVGPEFRVNTYTTGSQAAPTVAGTPDGGFVVVWNSDGQDGSGLGVFGQRYTSAGAPDGAEFRVNSYTTGNQVFAAAAPLFSGDFIVTWTSDQQDGSGRGVFGQRYDGAGAPLGPEFRVNSFTAGDQGPEVSLTPTDAAPGGKFVVVWNSDAQDGSGDGIFAQRYDGLGAPLGPEFRVNTHTTGQQGHPSVGSYMPGFFVVVWDSQGQDGSGYGVFRQLYSSSGSPVGPEFAVNLFTAGPQILPRVAVDRLGPFVIVWESDLQDGSSRGIFGHRYSGDGVPAGPEFRVNSYTTSAQTSPVVGSVPNVILGMFEAFIVAWSSVGEDGSSSGVFGQLYAPNIPVELMAIDVE